MDVYRFCQLIRAVTFKSHIFFILKESGEIGQIKNTETDEFPKTLSFSKQTDYWKVPERRYLHIIHKLVLLLNFKPPLIL